MFGSKKPIDNSSDKNISQSNTATNSIVKNTHIEGVVNAKNDIRIDGSLKGELHCNGRVIIGEEGKVNGIINCENAIIEGNFSGNLKVSDTLQVKESADISGDVQTGNLVVQAGAKFDVSCGMGNQKIKEISSKKKNETSKLKTVNV